MRCALATLALLAIAPACSRADSGDKPVTVLVLAPPPASAAPPPRIVADNGADPSVGAWGTHATFEDVARATETDAGEGRELPFEELLEPLDESALVVPCAPEENEHVRARVAVLRGRPIGVTVEVEPEDPDLSHCIERRIRTLNWPASERVQFIVKNW